MSTPFPSFDAQSPDDDFGGARDESGAPAADSTDAPASTSDDSRKVSRSRRGKSRSRNPLTKSAVEAVLTVYERIAAADKSTVETAKYLYGADDAHALTLAILTKPDASPTKAMDDIDELLKSPERRRGALAVGMGRPRLRAAWELLARFSGNGPTNQTSDVDYAMSFLDELEETGDVLGGEMTDVRFLIEG